MLEIKGQRPNELTWEDKHPSNYEFHKIDVSQFLPKKKGLNPMTQQLNKKLAELKQKRHNLQLDIRYLTEERMRISRLVGELDADIISLEKLINSELKEKK
jgi:hypothetical protein